MGNQGWTEVGERIDSADQNPLPWFNHSIMISNAQHSGTMPKTKATMGAPFFLSLDKPITARIVAMIGETLIAKPITGPIASGIYGCGPRVAINIINNQRINTARDKSPKREFVKNVSFGAFGVGALS
jgi:hypothetical protein